MSDPVRRAPPGSKLVVVASQAEEEVKRIAVEARYAVDPYSAKNLKEAGRRASMKLLNMIENEAIWAELSAKAQLAVITLALDRAYGRVENITAETKMGSLDAQQSGGALPNHLRALAGSLTLPEMSGARKAEKSE